MSHVFVCICTDKEEERRGGEYVYVELERKCSGVKRKRQKRKPGVKEGKRGKLPPASKGRFGFGFPWLEEEEEEEEEVPQFDAMP